MEPKGLPDAANNADFPRSIRSAQNLSITEVDDAEEADLEDDFGGFPPSPPPQSPPPLPSSPGSRQQQEEDQPQADNEDALGPAPVPTNNDDHADEAADDATMKEILAQAKIVLHSRASYWKGDSGENNNQHRRRQGHWVYYYRKEGGRACQSSTFVTREAAARAIWDRWRETWPDHVVVVLPTTTT